MLSCSLSDLSDLAVSTTGAPAKKAGFASKSGSLLGSALGSSVSSLFHGRPKMKTNGHFAAFMQVRAARRDGRTVDGGRRDGGIGEGGMDGRRDGERSV